MADKFNLDGFSVDTGNVCTADGGFVTKGEITADEVTVSSSLIMTNSAEIDGAVILKKETYLADATIGEEAFIELDASSASTDMTISPQIGELIIVSCKDATNSCTLTFDGGTFDGTNNTATFDAAEETLVFFVISETRAIIIENIGGVALSAV